MPCFAALLGVAGLLGSRGAEVVLTDAGADIDVAAFDFDFEVSAAGSGVPTLQVDLYRALYGDAVGSQTTENNNLASIGGVLKYLHTEVIPEHTQSDTRVARKAGIDTILRRRFKVKNTDRMPREQVQLVDFGPLVTFDIGQSTNADLDKLYQSSGEFVGVQKNDEGVAGVAVTLDNPYYWFSVTGFCPNLPWIPATETARCQQEGLCEAKGARTNPNEKCLKYTNGTQVGSVIRGGLCANGITRNETVPRMDPVGEDGCTYTYGQAVKFKLDEIVGITQQKCNDGQDCIDWLDFRNNCDDLNLQRKFSKEPPYDIIDAMTPGDDTHPFCVEYDIHPVCQTNCSDPICVKAIEDGNAEIGLPFWLGRCDSVANRRRFEVLAEYVGITDAAKKHQIVDDDILSADFPCVLPGDDNSPCKPTWDLEMKSRGGPYCSRIFSGVCQECYIPDTKESYRWQKELAIPRCPLSILKIKDYKSNPNFLPNCKSTKASDLCCLYTDSCNVQGHPADAPLDDDGLTYVAAYAGKQRDSAAVLDLMDRVAKSKHKVLDVARLDVLDFAYNQWGEVPRSLAFADFQTAVLELTLDTTTVTSTTRTRTTTVAADHTAGDKGGNGGTIAIIVVVVLVLVGGLAAVAYFLTRPRTVHFVQQQDAAATELPSMA